jgi:hypothetical protein
MSLWLKLNCHVNRIKKFDLFYIVLFMQKFNLTDLVLLGPTKLDMLVRL